MGYMQAAPPFGVCSLARVLISLIVICGCGDIAMEEEFEVVCMHGLP